MTKGLTAVHNLHVECFCLVRCADEAETLAWLDGGWNAERTAKWVSLQMGSRKNTPYKKKNPHWKHPLRNKKWINFGVLLVFSQIKVLSRTDLGKKEGT